MSGRPATRMRMLACVALLTAAVASLAPTAASSSPGAPPAAGPSAVVEALDHLVDRPTKDPVLGSALRDAGVAGVAAAGTTGPAAGSGSPVQILDPADVRDDGRVVVHVVADSRTALRRSLPSGATIQREVERSRFRVAIAPDHLDALAADPGVRRIEPRHRFRTHAITSEGATSLGVGTPHDLGIQGAVDVAIVDGGFGGWAEARQAGEVPDPVAEADHCPNVGFRGSPHGTAVAEIIHDVAPAARLHLICIEEGADFAEASAYVRAKGVPVVNASGGFTATGFGNGREAAGSPWHIVEADRRAGVFWAVSAGNAGEGHWGGPYTDIDGDDIHEFGPDALNAASVPAGGVFAVTLRWDEFDTPRNDLDLYVFDEYANLIGISDAAQFEGHPPVEEVWLQNLSSTPREVIIGVGRYGGSGTPQLDLFVHGTSSPKYWTRNRSVLEPATSPGAFAVGSVCAANNVLEPFSSAGPTADGRTKPDIVSYDAISGFTLGPSRSTCQLGFVGTSAAAPHVAGAAALLRDAHPDWGPDQVAQHLRANALDIGTPGPDNGAGWGRMRLGSIVRSGEYDADGPAGTIYRLYRAYLLREPDRSGYDYWNRTYTQGYPLGSISEEFARSPEFQERYGDLDDRRFLERVYANVLGRQPDQGGYAYWLDHMRRGMSRGYVMIYFSDSTEFRTKTADGRPPGF